MQLMSLNYVVACRLLFKPSMRANETFDSIDATDLAAVTGGGFLSGWFSTPAPAVAKSPRPVGKPLKAHKHSSGSNGEVLRPLGWGEGMYGWSQ